MPSLEADQGFLEVGIAALEAYLLSDQLFWPMGAGYPRLTIGGLSLALARSNARMQAGDLVRLARLERELETVRVQWQTAWERKAAWEFTSRLNQWGNYLVDYRRDREAQAPYYRQEVGLRVILRLLGEEVDEVPEDSRAALAELDKSLRSAFVPGAFIWEEELERGFPADEFWYLYGTLTDFTGSS